MYFSSLGNLDEALRDYSTALQIEPRLAPALYNRGKIYSFQRKNRAALADFTAALHLQPNLDALIYQDRGLVYVRVRKRCGGDCGRNGDPSGSIARLGLAHLFRAMAYARQGDAKRTDEDIRAALQIDPTLSRFVPHQWWASYSSHRHRGRASRDSRAGA